ncbi:MAG: inositol monophosphatase family protein [bacterium]
MLNKIIDISERAGDIIRAGFRTNFSIKFKTNESNLVTSIDEASERCIVNFIKKEFPTHGILTEESGNVKTGGDYLWVIDPLDGTSNFAHGLPIFSVSIGVQYKGVTTWGVIYDVMRDVVYSAELNNGAFENGNKLYVSTNDNINRSFLVTGFPYDIKDDPDDSIQKFNTMLLNSHAVRRLGSAAIDMCYVASGVFDGFWEVNLHSWDIAAGMLLIEEAGGIVTDFNNLPINIYSKQILATNRLVHNKMLELLNKKD